MSGPSEEVALLRLAVRRGLADAAVPEGTPLLVACSGGADSVALASATAPLRNRWPVHAAVVDHGLQDGSTRQAAETAALLTGLGLIAEVHQVTVTGGGGTEAAARRARYAALRAARPSEHSPVLLGHTLDDQAETVLLGLGRGSGARSIAGMRRWDAPWLRPLLGVRRTTTRAVCVQRELPIWDDPHNLESRFTRVRLRTEVLPLLEEVLAGGVAEALARTAAQLREDAEALDEWAARAYRESLVEGELEVKALADHPASVRRRVLRIWLIAQGVADLTDAALRRADDLVGNWRGQGEIALPRGWVLYRRHGRLVLGNRLGGAAVPPV